MTWLGILACAVGCYLLKLAGLAVPGHVLQRPAVRRVAETLPVALLAALVAVQVFAASDGRGIAVDARLAGVAAAAIALVLRAPFLVVVLVAASTAAVLRLL
ncbi:MAG TPA: AzlD domain-containing protein [Marmoricola sp.]|nr:AzlD domain-containing protein [Marmoricola sp.]